MVGALARISIVTATFNRLGLLRQAVASVRAQAVRSLEHLIVDGGSSDGTQEWVLRQPDLTLIGGPDRGVYDAWNKAVAAARGEAIGFLNSDDLYCSNAIPQALEWLERRPDADAVAGAFELFQGDAVVRRYERPSEATSDLRRLFLGDIGINAYFFRRECLQRLGAFSLSYPLVSDRDMMLRFADRGLKLVSLHDCLYRYRRHDGSLTFDRQLKNELALRHELLALARAWQVNPDATAASRRLARVLEGRSRIGLLRLAVRGRNPRLIEDARSPGFGVAFGSMAAAGLDYLANGR